MFGKRISGFTCVFLTLLLQYVSTGLKKKTRFLNFQRASSTKKKLAQQKLTFWEYVFSSKRVSKNPCGYQPANYQEQTRCEKNSHYQTMPGNVLVYTDPVKSSKDSRRLVELQPKPSPSYKPPKAVLLNKTMVEGFTKVAKSVQLHFCQGYFPRSESH